MGGCVLGLAVLIFCLPIAAAEAQPNLHRDRFAKDQLMARMINPQWRSRAAALPQQWCGQETARDRPGEDADLAHIKVVYAYPRDRANRFEGFADVLQANTTIISQTIAEASGGRKTVRFDRGTVCGSDYLDLASVALSGSQASYIGDKGFAKIKQEVLDQVGAAPGPRNFLVYADQIDPGSGEMAGSGEFYESDIAGPDNPNAAGGLFGIVWGDAADPPTGAMLTYQAPVLLHELAHSLGAVQSSAPHASGAGHCSQEYDVVCSVAGSSAGKEVFACSLAATPIREPFDCGQDDYFSPNPAPGSYLASHWNLYDSPFLQTCSARTADCSYRSMTYQAQLVRGSLRDRGGRRIGSVSLALTPQAEGAVINFKSKPVLLGRGRWRLNYCLRRERGPSLSSSGQLRCYPRNYKLERSGLVPENNISQTIKGQASGYVFAYLTVSRRRNQDFRLYYSSLDRSHLLGLVLS